MDKPTDINETISEREAVFWPLLNEKGYDEPEVRRLAEELRVLRRTRNDESIKQRDDPHDRRGER